MSSINFCDFPQDAGLLICGRCIRLFICLLLVCLKKLLLEVTLSFFESSQAFAQASGYIRQTLCAEDDQADGNQNQPLRGGTKLSNNVHVAILSRRQAGCKQKCTT